MKRLYIAFILFLGLNLQAQQPKDTVHTEVIEVTHSYEPKVKDAYKIDVNPAVNSVVEKKIPVNYRIQSVPVASTFSPEKGAMAGFNAGNVTENVYQSYVAVSGGNYTQIKGDAYVYYPVTQNMGTALRLQHYSTQGMKVDDGISYLPFGKTRANLLFDHHTEQSTLNIDLGYSGRVNNFKENYGVQPATFIYPVNFDSKHSDNIFGLSVNSAFKDLFVKDIDFSYQNYWDRFDNTEHKINLLGNLVFPVGGIDLKLGLQTDLVTGDTGKIDFADPGYDYAINYKNLDFGILPAVKIENDNLVVNIGAKIYYQDNPAYRNVQFIPDVNLNFNLIYETLTVFAGVTGDLKQNSYIDLSKNPYLLSNNTIVPSLTPYDIFGGFNGAFSGSFSYEVKMGFRRVENYAFYVYKVFPVDHVSLVYDGLKQSYLQTAINVGVGKKFDLKLDVTYQQNNADNLTKTPFLPDFEIKSILIFKPTDKLNFNLSLQSLSGRNADSNTLSLPGFTDLNAGVRYNINKQFTAFLNAYNILGESYQYYYNYPVQKFQIMGGVAYRFDIPSNN